MKCLRMNEDDYNRALSGDKNLSGADLSNADLSRYDFSEADLTKANLRESRMVGTNFRYADLTNADLTNANLTNAKIQNSYFKNAKMDNMIINQTHNDSCFEQDLFSKVICKIKLDLNPNSPPYETNYELRDNYSLRN